MQTGFLGPLDVGCLGRPRQYDHVGIGCYVAVLVRRHLGVEALDSRRLLHIRRFAGGDTSGSVDQPDLVESLPRRELVRQRPAQRAGADDGNDLHRLTVF